MNKRFALLFAALPIAFLAACGGDDDIDDRLNPVSISVSAASTRDRVNQRA